MTQTSVEVEDFVVEELLALRMAESKLAAELRGAKTGQSASLHSTSLRLQHLQARLNLLSAILDDSTQLPMTSCVSTSVEEEQVLRCA